MKKEYTLLSLGIWVMLFPYLGFPFVWRAWILGITGLCICFVAWRFWKDKKGPTEPITESLPKIIPEVQTPELVPTMSDMPASAPSPFIEHLKTRAEKVSASTRSHRASYEPLPETSDEVKSEIVKPKVVRKPRLKIMGNDIA
ncbi:MAG: hypothetical protein ACR2IQ_02045 [Minisyncoccia bacterium]